ncbi:MAG: FAD-dependent monooxygenase, partial [Mesorhizobium sp.]
MRSREPKKQRATIVGAGIAGLAAAHGLRLLGWDVEIYEQADKLE